MFHEDDHDPVILIRNINLFGKEGLTRNLR